MIYQLLRGDFFWFVKLDGPIAMIVSFVERVLAKVVVDYTGCFHFRYP